MRRRQSTWLVVALTVAAFAVGIAGGALVGGGGAHHPTSIISEPAASSPAPVLTVSTPRAGRPAPARTVAAPSVSPAPARTRTVSVPAARSPAAVRIPETNPLATQTPPPSTAAPAPSTGAPAPSSAPPSVTPPPAPSDSGEPVDVEPSARRAMAGAALSLLQAAAAESGEASAAGKVIQTLEQCLELVAVSSLPAGPEPPQCEAT
jgi:hypothetical protein